MIPPFFKIKISMKIALYLENGNKVNIGRFKNHDPVQNERADFLL